jgi:hypothetical protein
MAEPTDSDGTAAWDEDGAGGGETELVPPVTDAAPTGHAWSQDDETDEPASHPWPVAWATAGVLVLVAVTLVAVAGLIGWATLRHKATTASAPARETTVIVQAPPAPSTSTVTVQAAPPAVTVQSSPVESPETSLANDPLVQDTLFFERIRQLIPIPTANRQLAITDAHLVCDRYTQGFTKAQVVSELENLNHGLTDDQAHTFVFIAASYYCPKYALM